MLMYLWAASEEKLELAYRPDRPMREQLLELAQSKMRVLNDANFMDLARVAIAATIHSPERAQKMVAKLSEKEKNICVWIRAAQADGKLKAIDPAFAANQLQALLKASAFWPQITLGQPPLTASAQQFVVESTVDMFLACYELVTLAPAGASSGVV